MRKRCIIATDMKITDKMMSTVCFTGYRPQKLPWGFNENDERCISLKRELYAKIELAYSLGFTHFIAGGAMGVDMYAAEAVLMLKKIADDVTLEIAVPYVSFNGNLSYSLRERQDEILLRCDKTSVISQSFSHAAYMERNMYMVDNSALIIAVFDGKRGGTWNTVEYAQKKSRVIWMLDPQG